MSDWFGNLTSEERAAWDDFVRQVRADAAQKIVESAFVMQFAPDGDPDIKIAVELGLSIFYDKPLVLIAFPGQVIPPRLRRVADEVIELTEDFDTEAGQAEFQAKFTEIARDLGIELRET